MNSFMVCMTTVLLIFESSGTTGQPEKEIIDKILAKIKR